MNTATDQGATSLRATSSVPIGLLATLRCAATLSMKAHPALVALTMLACVHTAPAPTTGAYWIASDASQYTPVVRFRARVDVQRDHLIVFVDSATLSIPGAPIPSAPPLMSDLYLSAIVAMPDSTSLATVGTMQAGVRHPKTDRRGWSPLASSDSVLLIHELRYGETAPIPAIGLTVPGSFATDTRTLWLIFRIGGNTVQLMAPLTDGGPIRRSDLPGGVRVYACGDRDLLGRLDPTRARALKQAYGIAC